MIPNQQNQKERKPEMVSKMKKAHVIIPLIIVLMLMCIIPTIILILGVAFDRPTETAELDKNVEQSEEIKAAAVQSGKDVTIEKAGVYMIELHGGKSASKTIKNSLKEPDEYEFEGTSGTKTIGYIYLEVGDVISTKSHSGGGASGNGTAGGHGISAYLTKLDGSAKTLLIGYASGGPGLHIVRDHTMCARTGDTNCMNADSYSTASSSEEEMFKWTPGAPNKNGTASAGKSFKAIKNGDSWTWTCHPTSNKEYNHTDYKTLWIGGGGGSLYAGSTRSIWGFSLDW